MKMFTALLTLSIIVSCVSIDKEEEIPVLDHKSSISEMLNASLDHGGALLKETKKITTETRRWPQMAVEIKLYIKQNLSLENRPKLLRAAHLYQASVPVLEPSQDAFSAIMKIHCDRGNSLD